MKTLSRGCVLGTKSTLCLPAGEGSACIWNGVHPEPLACFRRIVHYYLHNEERTSIQTILRDMSSDAFSDLLGPQF